MAQESTKVVALYARVSTLDQNCEIQLEDLRWYAGKRFADYAEYADAGFRGTQALWPSLQSRFCSIGPDKPCECRKPKGSLQT
jgi:resolvase-like protein